MRSYSQLSEFDPTSFITPQLKLWSGSCSQTNKVTNKQGQKHSFRPTSMAEVIIIVTRPFYESRLNWVADPALPASRRLDDRTSPAPAPAIPTPPAEVHPRLPGHLRSRRWRRRKAAASANRNSASRPADLATPPTRPANDNSSCWASSAATWPRSTANDLPGIQPGTRSTSVEHPCSFTSSPLSQHPIPATSRNSDRPFCQNHSEIWGLYKPAQIYHSQDLTATRLRDISPDLASPHLLSSNPLPNPSLDHLLGTVWLVPIERQGSLDNRGQACCTRCCPSPLAWTRGWR